MSILLPISDSYGNTSYVDVTSISSIVASAPEIEGVRITTTDGVVVVFAGTFADLIDFWNDEFASYTGLGAPFTDTETYILANGLIAYLLSKLI